MPRQRQLLDLQPAAPLQEMNLYVGSFRLAEKVNGQKNEKEKKEVTMKVNLFCPYQAVGLFGARAPPGTEEMATLPWPGSEAPATVALGRAVDLAELLAVVGSLAPAPVLAGLVAGGAVPLRFREVVHVDVLRPRPRDDLLPLDGLDVAEVVVVQDAHAALEDIWGW